MKLREIAEAMGGRIVGDANLEISGLASLMTATCSQLSFVEDEKMLVQAGGSNAGALIVGEFQSDMLDSKSLVVCRNPRLAFAKAGALFSHATRPAAGVHASAVVHETAELGERVSIGALVYIGPGVKVGRGTIIGPGCMLLSDIEIGEDCELVARVSVYPHTRIGDRVVVHAGVVLGSDGFGFVPDQDGKYHKFPQVGRLEIGDDVEIGANSTVDRGALDATVIASGVKLDNLVHVGHNATVGENVVAAAQTGISGSSVVEKNVLIGGQVGIADHVTIEEGAILGAQTGVPSNKTIRGKGVVFWGTPARPIREYLKELAVLSRLAKKKSTS